MSAPVTERTRAATRVRAATIPAQRTAPAPRARTGANAGAAAKAYARREDRLRRLVGGRAARTVASPGRAQFVLLVMVLLTIGLVATLWLSTAAAADSYRLQDARTAANDLQQQSEKLRREVTAMDAPPALAKRATELGMVAVQDPARIVVAPDGSVSVVGEPRAATRPAPPVPPKPPAAAPAPAAGAPAAGTPAAGTPVDAAAAGAPAAPAAPGGQAPDPTPGRTPAAAGAGA